MKISLGTLAVLDANVLYPAPLRDFLLRLATARFFKPCWSAQIHDEWINSLLTKRPDLQREKLERTRATMNAVVRMALTSQTVIHNALTKTKWRGVRAAIRAGSLGLGLLDNRPRETASASLEAHPRCDTLLTGVFTLRPCLLY